MHNPFNYENFYTDGFSNVIKSVYIAMCFVQVHCINFVLCENGKDFFVMYYYSSIPSAAMKYAWGSAYSCNLSTDYNCTWYTRVLHNTRVNNS